MQYTIDDLRRRHSVRDYKDVRLGADTVSRLEDEVKAINEEYRGEGMRFELRFEEPEAFGSFLKSYGMFKKVRNYLVAVVDTECPDAEEFAGFAGERFAMRALSLGLGTCFVGATYDRLSVQVTMSVTERIAFLIAFGEPSDDKGLIGSLVARIAHRKSLAPEEFYDSRLAFYSLDEAEARLPWLGNALEALSLAPSALNKQPVRIWLGEDNYIHAGLSYTGDFTAIDLGIGKFNFQTQVPGRWEWGQGARFLPA